MFENTFKNIDDILHKDAGCSSELDYVEQSSWVLFLKYIDDLESARKVGAELANKKYSPIITGKYSWPVWAVPKTKDDKIDHNAALTGDDLRNFVNNDLFTYLSKFKSSATSPDTLEYKIGEIFGEITNKIQSGYNLREVLELVDQLKFQTSEDKHEMSSLYEDKIKNMGNAGRNGGEYYTPRPLIKAIIKVVAPKIGQTIYDGASGSAGFLCESFAYLSESKQLTTSEVATLQKKTFYGKEKKSLAYIIGTMNMILHGIDAPNLIHTNTLGENIADIQEKNRYDIVLANPPFGGKERAEVQQNFPIKTGETAYLFLQHFMKILRAGGSAGVVIKNTFLSNTDNASVAIRKELLENFNLHTILDCPSGTFQGAGVKTVVLFFIKGEPTKKIWYYQLKPGRNMGKTNPLNDKDLEEFLELQKKSKDSDLSWSVDISKVDQKTWDLSAKNPNGNDEVVHRSPAEIIAELESLDIENQAILQRIKDLFMTKNYNLVRLGDLCDSISGLWTGKKPPFEKATVIRNTNFTKDCKLDLSNVAVLDVETKQLQSRRLMPGDLIVEKSGGGPNQAVGRVVHFNESVGTYSLSNFTSALRIKNSSEAIPKYLQHFLYYQYISGVTETMQSNSTGIRNLNIHQFLDIEIPLPSIEKQLEIVEKLDSAFADIYFLERNVKLGNEKIDQLFESLISSAFTPNRSGIKQNHSQLNDSNSWHEVSLKELCKVDWGNTKLTKSSYVANGTFLAVSASGADGRIDYYEHESNVPVLSAIGAQCGKMFYPNEKFTAIKNTITLTPKTGMADGKFLYYLFSHVELPQRGAGQPFISKGDIEAFRVEVPINLKEQQEIVQKLDDLLVKIELLKSQYKKEIDQASALRQSLLNSAFTLEEEVA